MRGIIVLLAAICLSWMPLSSATLLAENGTSKGCIVLSDNPTDGEKTAANELSHYLEQVTGAAFPIVPESASTGSGPRIYVGPSAFARANALDFGGWGPEEWSMRTVGQDLILAGGRPRGTLYAVYHFLEDVVGVHWWNPFEETIPNRPVLDIPSLDRKGNPVIRYRDIYMLYGGDEGRFAARNRLNRDGDAGISGEYGGEMGYGPPYHVHTFNMYIPPETYFQAHPEWFSLLDGKRTAEHAQLCLTNPELRSVFLEKLKGYIEQSRASALVAGAPAPTVFDVSQNDWEGMCQCAACQAITLSEESEAGPLFEFVNYLAESIGRDYPEVYLDTLAYMMTQKPPKTIRPRDNVIVRLCDTGSNFTHDIMALDNTPFRKHLLRWSAITKNLRIWNYAVTYAAPYGLPLPTAQTYAVNYRFFSEHNVEGVFTEHEYPILADLRDFKVWIMMKTLEDPYQDYDALVRTFTEGFYGAAGRAVRDYLNLLQKASEAKPSYLSMGAIPPQYRYLTLDFMQEAHGLFEQAEKAVQDDAVLLSRVRHARLPLDRATLVFYLRLQREWAGNGREIGNFPFDRAIVAARCRDTWQTQIERRIPEAQRAEARAEMEAELVPLLAMPTLPPLPQKFRDMPPGAVFDYPAETSRNWEDQAKRVPDPEAESGRANRLELTADEMKQYALPMPWGVYDPVGKQGVLSKVLQPEEVPGPGYHWYLLGECAIGRSYYAYFFWSWNIQVDLEGALDEQHPEQPFEVWASIKFEGPGFPHGRPEQPNAISVERVVLVKTAQPDGTASVHP